MLDLRLPVFAELEPARRILIAGAGGGFDLFSGLPLFFALRGAGKVVFLASLSFANLRHATGRWLGPKLMDHSCLIWAHEPRRVRGGPGQAPLEWDA